MNEKIDVKNQSGEYTEHYSDEKFINKAKKMGKGLGNKAFHAAATLFVALKSGDMPKKDKLIILGALGYFIFPIDIVADLLPVIGLSDDAFIIIAALTKVYGSITDEMKEDGRALVERFSKKATN